MRVLTAHRVEGAFWRKAVEGQLVLPYLKPCGLCPGGEWDECLCSRLWFTLTHAGLCEVAVVAELEMDLDDYTVMIRDAVAEAGHGGAPYAELAEGQALMHRDDPPGTILRRRGCQLIR